MFWYRASLARFEAAAAWIIDIAAAVVNRDLFIMTANAVREAIDSGKPFRLRSGDGAAIDVPTRDHAFLNPSGRLVVVFTDNDGARLLDVALITAVDYDSAPENLGR